MGNLMMALGLGPGFLTEDKTRLSEDAFSTFFACKEHR